MAGPCLEGIITTRIHPKPLNQRQIYSTSDFGCQLLLPHHWRLCRDRQKMVEMLYIRVRVNLYSDWTYETISNP